MLVLSKLENGVSIRALGNPTIDNIPIEYFTYRGIKQGYACLSYGQGDAYLMEYPEHPVFYSEGEYAIELCASGKDWCY